MLISCETLLVEGRKLNVRTVVFKVCSTSSHSNFILFSYLCLSFNIYVFMSLLLYDLVIYVL